MQKLRITINQMHITVYFDAKKLWNSAWVTSPMFPWFLAASQMTSVEVLSSVVSPTILYFSSQPLATRNLGPTSWTAVIQLMRVHLYAFPLLFFGLLLLMLPLFIYFLTLSVCFHFSPLNLATLCVTHGLWGKMERQAGSEWSLSLTFTGGSLIIPDWRDMAAIMRRPQVERHDTYCIVPQWIYVFGNKRKV